MTDAIQAFTLTLPAGGSSSALSSLACPIGDSDVTRIIMNFPPGCSGLVNMIIESGGAQLYPLQAGTFFNFDDYALDIPVTNQITTGQWAISGYNLDTYPHTVSVYFFYDYLAASNQVQSSQLVSL